LNVPEIVPSAVAVPESRVTVIPSQSTVSVYFLFGVKFVPLYDTDAPGGACSGVILSVATSAVMVYVPVVGALAWLFDVSVATM